MVPGGFPQVSPGFPGFPQVQHFHGQQVVVEMVYEEVAKEVEEKKTVKIIGEN